MPATKVPREANTVEAEDAAACEAVPIEGCEECAEFFDLNGGFAWGLSFTNALFFICPECWAEPRERAAFFVEWIAPEDCRSEA